MSGISFGFLDAGVWLWFGFGYGLVAGFFRIAQDLKGTLSCAVVWCADGVLCAVPWWQLLVLVLVGLDLLWCALLEGFGLVFGRSMY